MPHARTHTVTNDVCIPLLPRQATTTCMDIQSYIMWLILRLYFICYLILLISSNLSYFHHDKYVFEWYSCMPIVLKYLQNGMRCSRWPNKWITKWFSFGMYSDFNIVVTRNWIFNVSFISSILETFRSWQTWKCSIDTVTHQIISLLSNINISYCHTSWLVCVLQWNLKILNSMSIHWRCV